MKSTVQKPLTITLLAFLLFALYLFPFALTARAEPTEKVRYAYMPADTVLYRIEESTYVPMVILPATYFVAILNEPADGDYLHVSYLDLTGFVTSASVEKCDYTPVYTCCKLTAKPNNDGYPVNLRDLPDHTQGKVLLSVPADATLTLYGPLSGSALIPAVGDEWRYVKYTADGVSSFGYVYSGHTSADPVTPNVIEKMPDTPITPPDTDVEDAPPALDTKLQIIFIVALSVPAVVIMLLLFRKKADKKPKVPRGQDT